MDTCTIIEDEDDDDELNGEKFNGPCAELNEGTSLSKPPPQMEPLGSRLIQMPPIRHIHEPTTTTTATATTTTASSNISANISYRDLCVTSCHSETNKHITTTINGCSFQRSQQQQLGPISAFDGQQSQKQGKRNKLSSMIETSVKVFIDGKANCLPACLLGAALVASALNIILLSFVVTSIQLNDRGFIGGKISWDDQMDSTIFRLATRLLGKSISMKSIESLGEGPLKLETVCSRHGNNDQDRAQNQHDIGIEDSCPILLAVQQPDSKARFNITTTTSNRSKFNYTAVNIHTGGRSASSVKLKIETDLLIWDLISRSGILTNQTRGTTSTTIGPIIVTSNEHPEALDAKVVADRTRIRLLEFDKKQTLISLPLEDQLNLDSKISSSIIVNEVLESPEITGSLEENLDIQTRTGNLACRSMESMKLVSKSAVARFSAFEDLVLSAPALVLSSAKQLYLPGGIQYSDSEPTASNMDTIMTKSAVKATDSMATTSNHNLRAYNLVAINEFLMAATTA